MKRLIHSFDSFKWYDFSDPSEEEIEELIKEFSIPKEYLEMSVNPTRLPQCYKNSNLQFYLFRIFDERSNLDDDLVFNLTRKISCYIGPNFFVSVHRIDASRVDRIYKTCLESATDILDQAVSSTLLLSLLVQQGLRTFYTCLDRIEAELEDLESRLFMGQLGAQGLRHMQLHRRQLSLIKRLFFHSQDLILRMGPVQDKERIFIQDLKETVSHLMYVSDEFLDDTTTLLNLQISLAAQKTNEVVRVLTIFSVFFMPLTFIVGIYGMNFEFMPELHWEHGYLSIWALMLIVTALIWLWFRHKGWLDGFSSQTEANETADERLQSHF